MLRALFLVCLTGAAFGCGVSQELYNARTNELERCQADFSHAQTDLSTARKRNDELASDGAELRDRVTTLETDRFKLASNLSATSKEMDQLRRVQAQAERRTQLYRSLKERLAAPMAAHRAVVSIRKGKMLVRIANQLLFDPGKAELKPSGIAVLGEVAAALREIPDRDFLVAGHTDSLPIKSSPFRSNWELSSARAVAVVRFLQGEGLDPRHLAAAGYSEFDPLSDGLSDADRALNQRMEIVVMPDVAELPTIDTGSVVATSPATLPSSLPPAPVSSPPHSEPPAVKPGAPQALPPPPAAPAPSSTAATPPAAPAPPRP